VLADERVDDAEGLTRAGRTQDDGGTEGIDDVKPNDWELLTRPRCVTTGTNFSSPYRR